MCAGVDPISSIEVLHIQDVMKIIHEQMEPGFDIPLCIKILYIKTTVVSVSLW